jgi:hypothetical protein
MEYQDWVPQEIIQGVYDALHGHTQAIVEERFEAPLRFTNNDAPSVRVTALDSSSDLLRFDVAVPDWLVEYVTRYAFVLAAFIETLNDARIPGAPATIVHRPLGDHETFEVLLRDLPPDTVLIDERIELFIDLQEHMWEMIFLHEMAHIVAGHLRFADANRDEWSRNTALSRGAEHEADLFSAEWVSQKRSLNPPPWRKGPVLPDRTHSNDNAFSAFVTCHLFLIMRIQMHGVGGKVSLCTDSDTEIGRYLPHEIRHFLMVVTLLSLTDAPLQERIERSAAIMTDAVDTITALSGKPPLETPTIFMELGFERQKELVAQVVSELDEHKPRWQPYALKPAPNLDLYRVMAEKISADLSARDQVLQRTSR